MISINAQSGTVITTDGAQGTFTTLPLQDGQTEPTLRLTFQNSNPVIVPASLLVQHGKTYTLPLLFNQLADAQNIAAVIPLVAEELHVNKEEFVAGGVRVSKHVLTETQVIDDPLFREEFEIEHIAKNQPVDTPAGIHQEGDATIIPLYEETLVVEKRLFLREELVIHKRSVEFHSPQKITRRREEAIVEDLKETSNSHKEDAPRTQLAPNLKQTTVAKTKPRRPINTKESKK